MSASAVMPLVPDQVATFEPGGPLPTGLVALEASAGTGKTYALTALAVRCIAERDLPTSALCVVSFTDAATAELRGRIRRRLIEAVAHLEAGAPSTDDEVLTAIAGSGRPVSERGERLRRLRAAVTEFDAATITTIHGFCSRLLASAGSSLAGDTLTDGGTDVEEAVNDLLLERFGNRADAMLAPNHLVAAVRTRLAMPDARMQRFAVTALVEGAAERTVTEHRRRQASNEAADLVDELCVVVRERRAARRRQTFDGLLVAARDLLVGPQAATTIAALRERYRMVLIDEFQDTDRVQWDIFRAAFVGGEDAPAVVLVGDPKQSIYRFRSAELSAYLDAVGRAGTVRTLATNWRSDRPVLEALGHVFDGFTFGDPAVAFQHVEHAPGHDRQRIGGVGAAAMEIRWIGREDGALDANRARSIVRNDVVAAVAELLTGTVTVDDGRGAQRPLRAQDIAILTRSNKDATSIALDLGAAGIPAASAASNSVLDGAAATQWAILLRALERPGAVGAARAAAVGWFLGRSPYEMATIDDAGLADLHDQLRDWSLELSQHGIPRVLALAGAAGLHQRLLAQYGGERQLTDIDHIGELLQAATGGRAVGASALLRILADGAGTDEEINATELLARRIDRDDDAVQVLTVHKAKGLEFPVVLCPSLWTATAGATGVPHAHVDGRRTLDSSWVPNVPKLVWTKPLRDANSEEHEGEQRRLLYVALTRARHRCVVWWAPTSTNGRTVLGDLLAHAGKLDHVPVEPAELDGLVGRSNGTIAIMPVQPRPFRERVTLATAELAPLEVAVSHRRLDRAWRRWSFSGIKSTAESLAGTGSGAVAGAPSADAVVAHVASTVGDVPLSGGADEPAPDDDLAEVAGGRIGGVSGRFDDATGDVVTTGTGGLATAPGGTEFGTLVHAVLEQVDFAAPNVREQLVDHITARLQFRTFELDPIALADGLLQAIDAPLGGPEGGRRLRDLHRRDRLDELSFDMPLGRLRAGQIGAVLADHLPVDDLLRPWAVSMAASGFQLDVAGMLNGSIDLVVRSDGGTRFWLADYKTNQLGPDSAYTREDMALAMAHHHYPLQAALYLVALHRYLRWRVPGYQPDQQLGGAAYLFLRGMDPSRSADDARGVFWWQPPAPAIVALDELLAGTANG